MQNYNSKHTELANNFAGVGAELLDLTGTAAALAAIPNTEPQQYAVVGTPENIAAILPATICPQRRQKHGDRPSTPLEFDESAATSGDAPADLPKADGYGDRLSMDQVETIRSTIQCGDGWDGDNWDYALANAVAAHFARIERAAAPAPGAPFAWMKPNEITGLIEASGKDGEARHYGRIYAQQYDADMVPVCAAQPATASGDELPRPWRDRIGNGAFPAPGQPGLWLTGTSAELAARDAEIADLRAAVSAATKPAGVPLNGIPATMRHDEGAIAQCSYCGRYSLDPATLSNRQPACECGQQHGWSGSFKKPSTDAKWSDAAPTAAPADQNKE